jgi:hypothetical protein
VTLESAYCRYNAEDKNKLDNVYVAHPEGVNSLWAFVAYNSVQKESAIKQVETRSGIISHICDFTIDL